LADFVDTLPADDQFPARPVVKAMLQNIQSGQAFYHIYKNPAPSRFSALFSP
jgi:hypothetical protein